MMFVDKMYEKTELVLYTFIDFVKIELVLIGCILLLIHFMKN